MLLISWRQFPTLHDQSEALPKSRQSRVISMEFPRSFLPDVNSRGNQCWRRGMSAVSSDYCYPNKRSPKRYKERTNKCEDWARISAFWGLKSTTWEAKFPAYILPQIDYRNTERLLDGKKVCLCNELHWNIIVLISAWLEEKWAPHLSKRAYAASRSTCLLRTNRQPINTWTLVPALYSFEDTFYHSYLHFWGQWNKS